MFEVNGCRISGWLVRKIWGNYKGYEGVYVINRVWWHAVHFISGIVFRFRHHSHLLPLKRMEKRISASGDSCMRIRHSRLLESAEISRFPRMAPFSSAKETQEYAVLCTPLIEHRSHLLFSHDCKLMLRFSHYGIYDATTNEIIEYMAILLPHPQCLILKFQATSSSGDRKAVICVNALSSWTNAEYQIVNLR